MRFSKQFYCIAILAMFVGCGSDTGPVPSADFFVAPDGDDTNTGTIEQPFATLERARDAIRERLAVTDTTLTVMLRGGRYYLDKPVRFSAGDSPSGDARVVYREYPGETPTLIGGTRITNWESAGDSLFKAHVTGDEFHQLFEDGKRADKARHPNKGYLLTGSGEVDKPATQFMYADGDLPEWSDIRGMQVFLWPGWDWFSATVPVADIDRDRHVITLAGPTHAANIMQRPERRYVIQGVRGALDRPGEFWLDPDSRDLFYRPVTLPIEDKNIVAPTVMRVLDIRGDSPEQPVRNITFSGIHVDVSRFGNHFTETRNGTHGDTPWNEPANKEAAVYLEYTEGCSIENCRITNAGYNGVSLVWANREARISGCEIAECGFHGILVSGYRASFGKDMDLNRDHTVTNNWIHDCGKLVGHGGGIFIWAGSHSEFSHNRIHDMPRYGICMKGQRYYGNFPDSLKQAGVTWEDHYDYVHSRNNVIAYNDIFRVSRDSEDNGFISFWGTGRYNTVDHNLMHTIGYRELGGLAMGLYIDDAADWCTITNNIVYDINAGTKRYCFFIKGINNMVENNILASTRGSIAAIRTYEMADEEVAHHTYRRNIIALDGESAVYHLRRWEGDKFDESDYNLLHLPDTRPFVVIGNQQKSWNEWRTLSGQDEHSILGDPGFTDPKNGDFSLPSDSPAFDIGFEPIDTSVIGLLPDHLYYRETDNVSGGR